ncbi:ribosomal protein L27, partial [Obelidium mucronatum]
QVRHATKKAGGSTSNGRSSQPKHLGVKTGNGARVQAGTVMVKQNGSTWHAGPGVGVARDHTLFALRAGRVAFRFDGVRQRRVVAV